jgi:hypothetical protein
MRRHEVICKAPIAPESRPGALIFAVAGRPASRRMADPAPYARTRYDSVAYAGTVRSDRFPPCRGWKAGPAPGLAMAPSVRGPAVRPGYRRRAVRPARVDHTVKGADARSPDSIDERRERPTGRAQLVEHAVHLPSRALRLTEQVEHNESDTSPLKILLHHDHLCVV